MRPEPLENELSAPFRKLLKLAGFKVFRFQPIRISPEGTFLPVDEDDKGGPDYLACFKGRFFGFELKRLHGRQSEDQERQQREIERSGGQYILIKDMGQALRVVQEIVGQLAFDFNLN